MLAPLLNKTLGLALVDTEAPDPLDHVPDERELGQPSYADAPAFHDAAVDAAEPALAARLVAAADEVPSGVVNIGYERMPITHLIREAGGPMLPLVISHENPLPDRPVRVAQLWRGDLLLAGVEVEAVTSVMASGGVDMQVVDATIATLDDFVGAYTEPSIDVLWLSSHAALGHWTPGETALLLSETLRVSIDQIGSLEAPGGSRRLLVCNTCDSAAATALGGPSKVGIAGVTASARQAVVSHLWPVRWRAAAVFGSLLALGLIQEAAFVAAFDYATTPRTAHDLAVLFDEHGRPEMAEIASHEDERTFLDLASPVFAI